MNTPTASAHIAPLPPLSTREGRYFAGDARLPRGLYSGLSESFTYDGVARIVRESTTTRHEAANAVLRRAARIGLLLGAPVAAFARATLTDDLWRLAADAHYYAQDILTLARASYPGTHAQGQRERLTELSRIVADAAAIGMRPDPQHHPARRWESNTSDCAATVELMDKLDDIVSAEGESALVLLIGRAFYVCRETRRGKTFVEVRDAAGTLHRLETRGGCALRV